MVTEYGVAYVHGKSIRERAMALISIAHPKFRDELLEAAKNQGYVFKDQILPVVLYPKEYETYWTDNRGTEIFFRPVKSTDERAIQDMIYALPEQDVYTRFFQNLKSFSHRLAMPLAAIDYNDKMAIAAVTGRKSLKAGRRSSRSATIFGIPRPISPRSRSPRTTGGRAAG